MAVMTDPNRAESAAEYNRIVSHERVACPITKADIRAAINGLDDYLHTNATAINTAIPQPARSALSTAEKARLMQLVITKRYLTGT